MFYYNEQATISTSDISVIALPRNSIVNDIDSASHGFNPFQIQAFIKRKFTIDPFEVVKTKAFTLLSV